MLKKEKSPPPRYSPTNPEEFQWDLSLDRSAVDGPCGKMMSHPL